MLYSKLEDDVVAIKDHMINVLDMYYDSGRCSSWRPPSEEEIIDFIVSHFNEDVDFAE